MEGIPLQLLMSMLIIAMVVPMLHSSLQSYDETQVEMEVKQEMLRIIRTARDVYLSGLGNVRTLEIDLPQGPMCSLDTLSIGGSGLPYCHVFEFVLSNGDGRAYVITQPEFPVCSYGDSGTPVTLTLGAGSYTLSISYVRDGLDFDGDGQMDDHVRIDVMV